MAEIALDIPLFRQQIPAYASPTAYPDAIITVYWGVATEFVDKEDFGCLNGTTRAFAINLATAHLISLSARAAKGKQGGFVVSSSIDKVSVQRLAPQVNSSFDWWLVQSPYGQQLLALLDVVSVGGFSVGGLPETRAFRKTGGLF